MAETDEKEFYELVRLTSGTAVSRQSRTQDETRGSAAVQGYGFVRKEKKKNESAVCSAYRERLMSNELG